MGKKRLLIKEEGHHKALKQMALLESYYEWVYERFSEYIGYYVLDAGCGVGSFSALIEERAKHVWAADISAENLRLAEERFSASDTVEVVHIDFEKDNHFFNSREVDTIVCLDFLEHIEDDKRMLEKFLKVINPGGYLLLKVPACKNLFGSIDIASGHYRRYNAKELARKCLQIGWIVKEVGYMNVAGVVPYWIKSRGLKRKTNFSRTFSPWQMNMIRKLVTIIKRVDALVGPPFGLSALVAARKPR
jgi:2-polyprenyl-3-methyl-5-hydroxy-6-metoxy-1,4-benzoquinol methylase